jgi:hypothetical protein
LPGRRVEENVEGNVRLNEALKQTVREIDVLKSEQNDGLTCEENVEGTDAVTCEENV